MAKYPYDKNCAKCGSAFTVKASWQKNNMFCSHACSNDAKRIHSKEDCCINCGKKLGSHQRKFCSRSCAASVNNQGIRRHGSGPNHCVECGNLTKSSSQKYCSRRCSAMARKVYDAEHHRKRKAFHQSVYRTKKYRRTSPDADKEKIKQIYLSCPPGYEVDHIVPLSLGGLHHENNLQYLTIEENRRKGNRWIG